LPDLDIGVKTVDQAFEIAENESPDLKQAYFTEAQSRANVSATKSAYNGSLSASFQYGYSGSVSPFDPRNLQNTALGQVTYTRPLYTSGLDRAQVRQALDLNQSDRFAIETVRRNVIQSLANGWNQMVTASCAITAQEAQVNAAAIAFKGMRLEYRAGDRSTLDVLVAEETLRDAELQLVSAKRDAALAKAIILRQLGRLSLSVLAPTATAQDPSIHFAQVIHDAPRWTHLVERADRLGKRRIGARFPAKSGGMVQKSEPASSSGANVLVTTLPTDLSSFTPQVPK
jgi:outer membrane protein